MKKPKNMFDEMDQAITNFGVVIANVFGIVEEPKIEFDCEDGMDKDAQERMKSFDLVSHIGVVIKSNDEINVKAWMILDLCYQYKEEVGKICQKED